MKSSDHGKNRTGIVFFLIFIALAAGILAGGYFAYRNYERNYRTGVEEQLSAIAESKVDQLVQWRKERNADGEVFFRNDAFSVLVKRYLQNPNDQEAKRGILTWVGQVQRAYSYDLVMLFDARFNTKLVFPQTREQARLVIDQRNTDALLSGNTSFQDFYRNEQDRRVYLKILVPILDDHSPKRMIALLALRIDPTQSLYPMIEKWPTRSKTSETLIIRREGNEVLYLNDIKFRRDAALNLRIPLERNDVLAVQAVLGTEGVVEGTDYRGEHVIGNLRAVPNSPWFMVARMDYSEVFAPLRERLWIMIILAGALLAGAGASVGSIWRYQRNRFYREQYKSAEALRESEALLQSIIDNSTSLIYIVDTQGRFLLANRALTSLLSVSRGALVGNTREVVMPKEIADLHRKNDLEVVDSGRTSVLEEENLEQDGKHTYLSIKYPLFNSEGKIYAIGGMSTDITARKRAEDNLRASNEYLEKLINYANAPIIVWDTTLVITRFNHAFEQLSGYKEEEVKGKSIEVLFSEGNTEHSLDLIRRAVGGERWETVEIEIQRKDGDPRIVLWNSANVLGNDGKTVLATIAQGQDITARKQAENALRDSEVRFRQTFALSPVGIVVAGLDKRFHHCNSAFSQFLGYSMEELVGKSIEEVTFVEDRHLGMAEMMAMVKGETKSSNVQKRYVRKDGKLVWGEVTISLIRDQEDQPQYFLSIIQDITDRKRNEAEFQRHYEMSERSRIDLLSILEDQRRAQEALIALSSRHEAILAAVPDIIMEVDNNKVYTWANQSGVQFFGDNVIGKEADSYFEGEQDTYKVVQSLFNGSGNTVYLESWQRRKDGQKRLLGWWCRVLKDGDGKVIGALSSARDITERRRAEEALRESQSLYHSFIEQLPNAVFRKDREGRYVLVNPHFCRLNNLKKEDFIGKKPMEVAANEMASQGTEGQATKYADVGEDVHEQILQTGNSFETEEVYVGADGGMLHMYVVRMPVHDSQGTIIGTQGIMFDVSERKRAEEEIRRLNAGLEIRVVERTAQLEAANKELEAFSYSVSHDLRAPLRAVDGFSRIVLEEYGKDLDPEASRLLNVICANTQKMDELITDLLDLSRVSRNEMKSSRVAMTMLVNSIYHEAASPEILQKFSFSVDPIPDVYCDPGLMRQVWRNLISNAIKFTMPKDERTIEIGGRTHEGMNVYFIKDSGVGFDPRYSHKLFGVFQRLHKAEEFEGTGVGLAIVQRIIHRHGGKVWAEGKVGEGATFWFSIPSKEELVGSKEK